MKASLSPVNFEADRFRYQRKRKFARQRIKNSLNRKSLKIQAFNFAGTVNSGVTVAAEISSYGMNKYTKRIYEHSVKETTCLGIDTNGIRTMSNIICDEAVKQPFTDEFIVLMMPGVDALIASELLEQGAVNLITVQYCPNDNTAYIWFKGTNYKGEEVYTGYPLCCSLEEAGKEYHFVKTNDVDSNGNHVKSKGFDEAYAVMKKPGSILKKYGFIYAGPSNQRQVSCFAFKMHDGEDQNVFLKRIAKEFNLLTGGILNTLKELVEAGVKCGKPIQYKKLYKLVSRISLAFTPMTPTFATKCFAYYNGAFGDTGHADGQWLVSAERIAEYYDLDVNSVVGLGLQARVITGIIGKGMSIPKKQWEINAIIEEYGNTQYIEYADFRKRFINHSLEDKTMYIVYLQDQKKATPSFVFDENTMKMVGGCPQDFIYEILEMRTATRGKLNTQDLSCMQHLPGCQEMLLHAGKKYIFEEFRKLTNIIRGKISERVVDPDAYFPQLAAGMCPKFCASDASLWKSNVDAFTEGVMETIHNMNFPLTGGDEYRYFQSDYADMFLKNGFRVLGTGEVYIPGVKSGKRVIITRNPKADAKEFYYAVTVGLDDIWERIQKLDCSEKMRLIIWNSFFYADDSLVIVPADERFTNTTGGSDFDGDGGCCHFLEEFIDVQLQEPEGVSIIPGPKKTNKTVKEFNEEVLQGFMLDGLFGQKDKKGSRMTPVSVGVNSNHASKIRAMRLLDDKELNEIIHLVIKPNVKALYGKNYKECDAGYARRFDTADVEISDDDVVEATKAYYQSNMNLIDTRKYLEDCCRMGGSVIGRGIDQNKNGDEVHSGYMGVIEGVDIDGKRIRAKGLMTVKLYDQLPFKGISDSFCLDENGKKIFKMSYDLKGINPEKHMLIKSKLTPVIEELMAYASRVITYLYNYECKESATIFDYVNGAKKDVFTDRYSGLDLVMASRIHGHLLGADGLISKEKELLKRAIANSVRMSFTDGEADSVKFFAVKRAAAKLVDKDITYSSFEHILRKEFVAGMLYISEKEGYAMNDNIGWEVYIRDIKALKAQRSESVDFVDGLSTDGNIVSTNKHLNGRYAISHINGKWYATVNAYDYFKGDECTDEVILGLRDFNLTAKEAEDISGCVNKWNILPSIKDFKVDENGLRKGVFKVHSNALYLEDALADKQPAKIEVDSSSYRSFNNGEMSFKNDTRLLNTLKNKVIVIDSLFQWNKTKHNNQTKCDEKYIESVLLCHKTDITAESKAVITAPVGDFTDIEDVFEDSVPAVSSAANIEIEAAADYMDSL